MNRFASLAPCHAVRLTHAINENIEKGRISKMSVEELRNAVGYMEMYLAMRRLGKDFQDFAVWITKNGNQTCKD